MRFSSVARRAVVSTLAAGVLGAALTAGVSAAAPDPTAARQAVTAAAPPGTLTTITPGLKGYDSGSVETPSQINCLSAAGYSFDVINTNGTSWQNEYNAAAATGMKIVLFQGYDPDSWAMPAASTSRAASIRDKAIAAGYPKGGQIFLNMEDNVGRGVNASQMLAWINNWAAIIRKAGYSPGIYVGVPQLLTSAQINSIPGVVFWRSFSNSAPQAGRGFVVRQTTVSSGACGITGGIDADTAGADTRGVKLVGAAFPRTLPHPTVGGAFVPLTPARLLDTRTGLGAAGPVGRGGSRDLQITGRGGVPSGAAAVVLNVTATSPTAGGSVTIYPTGGDRPTVSTLNFTARQSVANLATVRLGTGGRVRLFNGSAGTVQLLGDVAGYYLAGSGTQPGTFTALPTPVRLLDTRPGGVAAYSHTNVVLADRGGLPPSSAFDSVVLNATAVSPAAAGYLTVYPAGKSQPNASNLNFAARQTVPNMVTAGSNGGQVTVYNGSAARTNLLIDVAGSYRSGTRVSSGAFTPLVPVRILNTRGNVGFAGRVAAGSAMSLLVKGRGNVPGNASAVVLNVTVTRPATNGYLTAFPSDRSAPIASNINFLVGQTVANQVIVPIGADGRVVLLNQSAGSTDLLADVAGFFRT